MVPRAGLEPAQVKTRRILSPLRLPFRHPGTDKISSLQMLEAAPGFEPGIRVLQTHALPLGYAAIFSTHMSNKMLRIFYKATCNKAASCCIVIMSLCLLKSTNGSTILCKYNSNPGPSTGNLC